jgi:Predicted dehydrogenases and related proteins
MKQKSLLLVTLFFVAGLFTSTHAQIKIGIIGLDTSHSVAFAKFLNGDDKKEEFKDFRIVAAYPYGSKTIKSSYDRIPGYIKQVEDLGVEVVSSISDLLQKVDYVMLETNDGNLHLEQAYEVVKAGKTLFIDKPLGASLAQSIAIFELARQYNVPMFSSSSLRFVAQTQKIREGGFGKVLGVDCYSPHRHEPSHPDFGWYGIHGVEMLFTVMGTGCVSVNRMSSDSTDVVIGKWNDGRIGTFRGIQNGKSIYGGTAYTTSGAVPVGPYQGYESLLNEILNFFKTGIVPVSEKETLEIFTFMEASSESKRKGGKIISMEETYRKAEKEAKKLIRKLN